jgi:lipopolysaccharide biosynthesis glycosyltransferase
MILGAVIDGIDPLIKIGTPALAAVPRVSNYFNAGVLLIDLCRWRIERIAEITLDYLHRYPHSPFSDQDAINAACDGRWQALDPRWNYQGHRTVRISNLTGTERPGIVHFITSAKPWCYKSCSLNAAFYDEFRSCTSFARTPPERLADELMSRLFQMHLRLNRYDAWQSTWRLVKRLGTYSRMSDELF